MSFYRTYKHISMISFKTISVLLAAAIVGVSAETHTVHFTNRCGRGTPKLVQAGRILSNGEDYTSNGICKQASGHNRTHHEPTLTQGSLTGNCLLNGEHCMTIETTLVNPDPARPGSGSSTDLSLIPPLAFSVTSGFGYYNGCDGAGSSCNNANCNTAFHIPTDTFVQVGCQTNNVNLAITFC
ncbi:hypothetical protein GALMADRAFT_133877 [Galerina marginata CBS 339.88]|uniref:Glycopeptide n=1 Tax=Galerina marginata (strain CBS 339.88) TaxID=685588 RepID=A0A067TQL7_GALM3|nr:hypothetical protein GALMADRAFT_133877 [Galerina marginata CBS 339.88]